MSAVTSHPSSKLPYACSNAPAFPKGNRNIINAHLKEILSDPNGSMTTLENTVEDLLKIAQAWDQADFRFDQWIWPDFKEVVEPMPFLRTLAFLRILGQKYYARTDFDIVEVFKTLTDQPTLMFVLLDGLREGSDKGRWPADRYALEVVRRLLELKDLHPDCIPVLLQRREDLQKAVDALPFPDYPAAFDHKAAAVHEKELLTPKKRLKWHHITKIYFSNLVIKSDKGEGLRFQECLLDLLVSLSQNGKLSQRLGSLLSNKVVRDDYYRILHAPAEPHVRAHKLRELLTSSFKEICAQLTEADKAVICCELEKILLETIYKWAGFLDTIDDRKEGWIAHKLKAYQDYAPEIMLEQHQTPQRWPNAPLDQCERKMHCLKNFSLKLTSFKHEPALLEQNATRFILEHRREMIEKAFAELLETL